MAFRKIVTTKIWLSSTRTFEAFLELKRKLLLIIVEKYEITRFHYTFGILSLKKISLFAFNKNFQGISKAASIKVWP